MNKVTFFGMLLFFGLFITGCAGVAHIEKDETVNFNNYKTFAWVETTESKEVEKDKKVSDLTEENLKKYVNSELTKQGWKEVKNKPDVQHFTPNPMLGFSLIPTQDVGAAFIILLNS